jgi:hypothetical protein
MRLTIQTKLFLSHFAAIILVSGSIGSYFYHSAIESLIDALQFRLKNSASLISQGLQASKLDEIRSEQAIALSKYRQYIKR